MTAKPPAIRILIRADASPDIGLGHIRRCFNLASTLKTKGASVLFASYQLPETEERLLRERGIDLVRLGAIASASRRGPNEQRNDAESTLAAIGSGGFDWIVVDHYGLGADWERQMRRACRRIAAIDDLPNRIHDCDLLLDQNLREDGGLSYSAVLPIGCERLLGPRYALLSDAFPHLRLQLHATRERVLISFGGSDPRSVTLPVLQAFLALCGTSMPIDVVVGSLNRDADTIRRFVEGKFNVRFHYATTHMAELFGQAQLFIGAGGSTSWERCCLAVPGVVVSVTDNQVPQCRALEQAGSHVYLGDVSAVTPDAIAQAAMAVLGCKDWRTRLAEQSSRLVDGIGAHRVANRLLAPELRLREATASDEQRLLEWRNHPTTRRYSDRAHEIAAADHSQWFVRVLADRDCHLLIGEDGNGDAGVLRYDVRAAEAKVSIYLVPDRIGSGIGGGLLAAGERWLAKRRPDVTAIVADVHMDNQASLRLFNGAGFRSQRATYVKRLAGGELQ